ncbi:TonB-dependent receptor [Nisaea sediminum]|uniref:TonB-dependent receptor n=1 Tax=Nisaea sediminum TaxID=2775867 RepID=UPI001866485E|nr:TonB-dependent siderophore receptor [Nisaea sediminum]
MWKVKSGKVTLLFAAATAILAHGAARAQDSSNQSATETLKPIVVEGSQVELTETYAGGQVATGGRAGLLGNLDFLESPFSGSAYTQELIENQQADSIGDVLKNDPTVRVAKGFGNFQEVYVIRGFPVYSDDITLNGLYGILPRQFVSAGLMERVEVFRGANAFINGAAPGGSAVGGTVNLVPKRAPDEGIRSITGGVESDSQFLGALDLGERFGPSKEWGLRFNAVGRDGETAIDDEERSLLATSLGTDFAGERFRFSVDLGYQDNRIDSPRPQVTPLGDVPDAPDSTTNYGQDWTYTDERQLFGAVRGELDVTDHVTVWLAGGVRDGDEANVLANPSAAADGSLTAYRFDNTREDSVVSGDAGMRGEFRTGPVGHRVVASVSATHLESKNAYAFSSFSGFSSNLYNPVDVAAPDATFFTGGDLDNPLKTEETTNSSVALADTLSFFDDRLLTTLGVRYQQIETKTFDYNTGAEASSYSDEAITPALGIVYKAMPNLSLYGNYAEALQPGEIAPATSGGTAISNAGEALEPFKSEQIEIGVKYDLGTFGATASVFSITQQNAIVENQAYKANGEQRNQGIELTVFGEPMEGVRLLGGVTFIDAELEKTEGGTNEGNKAIGVPEFQGTFLAEWDLPYVEGLTLDGRVTYTGEQYVNEANTVELDSWATLDLGVRYVAHLYEVPVTFRGRVDNVTDESYWASTGGYPGANYLIQGRPRTFMLTMTAKF